MQQTNSIVNALNANQLLLGALGYKNDELLILGFVTIFVGFGGNIAAMYVGAARQL
eukprot:SAG22_NODE_1078_length_5677_cov_5.105952_4_plen_56_part_00